MKINKKQYLFSLGVIFLLAVSLVFAGCGQKNEAAKTAAPAEKKAVTIKVGATPVPHAEILEFIKSILAKEGINLEIVTFQDYVQPNLALDQKELDANFFQHIPYLETFNKDHNLKLVSIAKVHIEPIGFYSQAIKSLDQIKTGSTIAIPNDPTNGGRALALLEKAGLIKLKDGVGIKGTEQDIVNNPKQLKFKALEAAQLPRALPDVAGAVINTNYALEAKLNPGKDAIVIEGKDSPYANILVVKEDRAKEAALQKLAQVLTSPEVKKFIEDKYKGSILPAQELVTPK
ncbi:MAG: MetQ/NlpA family ABC transporter substrate-binding protein [Pelosinus sp.]|nr:MetQ/NlpA family ABC transporter substrate-binding protein [Pelosinus sp.]